MNEAQAPEWLYFHPVNGLFFEDEQKKEDDFHIMLWPGVAVQFKRMPESPKIYVAVGLLYSNCPDQHPITCVEGVRYSIPRAIEALSSISILQRQGLMSSEWPPQSNL